MKFLIKFLHWLGLTNLSNKQVDEYLNNNFLLTYECPKCQKEMLKQPSFDIWHCLPCSYSYDTWSSDKEPNKVKVNKIKEYDIFNDMIVLSIHR